MKVSVIVPTYNGVHKISSLLHALEKQTHKDFELIIVIDGSTDNTLNYLNSTTFDFPSIKIIEQLNTGRAKVRNNGVKFSTGELLIFFDDDMIPLPHCIEEHIKHHLLHPNTILTGGQIEDEKKCSSDIQFFKLYLSTKWSAPLRENTHEALPKNKVFISAANFSLKKVIFNDLRGFDEQLSDAEDYDFAVRANQLNIPVFYNYKAFAYHNDPITCKSYIKRQREYVNAKKKLIALKPNLYNNTNQEFRLPTGFKKIVFLFFAKKIWIWTLDHFNWLMIFPKNIRYKIYEIIITANGAYFPKKVKI